MKKLLFGFILIFNFMFADATKDLFEAVKKVDISAVKLALSSNANPNGKDEKGNTPLDYMFDFDNDKRNQDSVLHEELININTKYSILQSLIDEGVNINYTKIFKDKVLFLLTDEIHNVCIMHGMQVIMGSEEDLTKFKDDEIEILNIYLNIFKLLLNNGISSNLSIKINDNNVKIINYITAEFVNLVNVEAEFKKNSVDTLKQIIDFLLEKNADYEQIKSILLLFEVKVNNQKTVEKLLKSGATVNVLIQNEFPLYVAAKNNSTEIMKLLIKNGAYIDGLNEVGETPLYVAVLNGALEATKLLIEKEADVNVEVESNVLPPLMVAIMNENENKENSKEIIKLLIEGGANVNYKISDRDLDDGIDSRFTPLCYASNIDTIKLLIEKGANINNQSEKGLTVLMNVDSLAKEKLLIEKGANINAIDNKKNSVLLNILLKNKENPEVLEMTKLLMEKGVDLKLLNNEGKDALMIASEIGIKELVNMLIEKGVDVKRRNQRRNIFNVSGVF